MALSRELYRKIKNYSREEMEAYLSRVYQQGHNDGVTALSKTLVDKIDKGVRNAPCVGEKRYAQIMDSINKELVGE